MAEADNDARRGGSVGRRTRSQAAPEWTTADALILVNEVVAVESDCQNALSSYQKWKIIAENCTALGVARTLDQFRRKWGSLLEEYNSVRQCDAYWSLEIEQRRELGLPDHFDDEVFEAIDNFNGEKEERADTDPENDPEAVGDVVEVIAESVSKRPRCQSMPQQTVTVEENEQTFTARLHENAEMIRALLEVSPAENADHKMADLKNQEDFKIDCVRRKGDKLIACLGEVVNNLELLCDLFQES